MKLADRIKTALDEVRMQMLGLQVLLGFQLDSLFQPAFPTLPPAVRAVDAVGLASLIVALGILLGVPCQHRLVEQGESTPRLFNAACRAADIALLPLALGIGCDVLVAAAAAFGTAAAGALALPAILIALLAWYGLARALQATHLGGDQASGSQRSNRMGVSATPLHAKIEQMLTEARVILPGAQALLGFQMLVMLTPAFKELEPAVQRVHTGALLSTVLAVVLLICPAAVHRMAFAGADDPRMHSTGSWLITLALGPLALGIALDVDVAMTRLFSSTDLAACAAAAVLVFMAACWYALPLYIRHRQPERRRAGTA